MGLRRTGSGIAPPYDGTCEGCAIIVVCMFALSLRLTIHKRRDTDRDSLSVARQVCQGSNGKSSEWQLHSAREATRAPSERLCMFYVLVMVIGRVPLGAPLACVRSLATALQEFRMQMIFNHFGRWPDVLRRELTMLRGGVVRRRIHRTFEQQL